MTGLHETIWMNLPFPAFVLDGKHLIKSANSQAEQIVQQSEKQLLGRNLATLFGENSILLETIRQSFEKRSSFTQYGVELVTAKRKPLFCDIHIRFLDEKLDEVLVIAHPTGVAQKMNQSLTHATAARSVTAMASMLAHEIRNPLAGISGAAQLLSMNANPDEADLAEMIDQETKRIGQLVDRFEVFSDDRPVAPAPVNIHDILDRAERSAAAGFGSNCDFVKEYDPSIPEASGDADQLLQAFLNLLKNASEAMGGSGGLIKLTTAYNSGVKFAASGNKSISLPLQIEVIDNGPGVPENLLDEIFDPFVSSKSNGTGLGLSFVSKTLAAHGGLIECKSSSSGTKFTIRLPVWAHEGRG